MNASHHTTSVGVVEDNNTEIEWLKTLLEGDPEYVFHGAERTEAAAVARFGKEQPDILLVDIDLGPNGGNGLNVVAILKNLGTKSKMVITSKFGDEARVFPAFQNGAESYLWKPFTALSLFEALGRIRAGDPFMSPGIARLMIDFFRRRGWIPQHSSAPSQSPTPQDEDPRKRHTKPKGTPDVLDTLSQRQWEVLNGIAAAKMQKEIADELHISKSTLKTHVSALYLKLGVETNTAAIKKFTESNSPRKRKGVTEPPKAPDSPN